MEYAFTNATTSDGHTQYKATVKPAGAAAPRPLTYEEAVHELKKEDTGGPLTFAMIQALAASPYPAVVMELPCAMKFEFVLINCPELSDPNLASEVPAAFQNEFAAQAASAPCVVHFIHNGNVIIIAPRPISGVDPKAYVDLKRFAQAAISAGPTSDVCKQVCLFLSQLGGDILENGVDNDRAFWCRTPSDSKLVHFQGQSTGDNLRHVPYRTPAPQQQQQQQAPAAAAAAPFGGLPSSTSFPPSTSSHKRSMDGPGSQQQPQQPAVSNPFGANLLGAQQIAAPAPLGGLAGAGSLFGSQAPAPAPSTTSAAAPAPAAPAPSLFGAPSAATTAGFGTGASLTGSTTDGSKPLVPGGLPAPTPAGAATAPSLLQPQAPQQQPAGEAPHPSLNLQGTEEGRRFEAEFAKASLKAVHAELMNRYLADTSTFEWQQAALLEGEQAVLEARAMAMQHEALFIQAKARWEAVEHEMSALEGKLNDLDEHDLPEAEAYASTMGGGGDHAGSVAGGMGGRLLLAHHHHHHMDDNQVERAQLWKAVLKVEQRLTRVRTMVRDLAERVSLQLERDMSEDGSSSMLVRILNAHQQSMEWAQRSALNLEHEARALEWAMRTSARLPVATDLPPSTTSTFLTPGGVTYQAPPPLPPSTTTTSGFPALGPSSASGGGGGVGLGGGTAFSSLGR